MHRTIQILVVLMILTSFITHTIDIDSENFIIARMTFSDIFGLLAIGLFGIQFLKDKALFNQIPMGFRLGGLVVLCFLISIVTSLSVKSTLAEVIILMYLIILSITIYFTFKDLASDSIFAILTITTFILSSIGIYDVIAVNIGFPKVFESANKYFGVSGFRYFGQAANYSFTMLTLLIPLKYSDFSTNYSKSKKIFLNITILLCMLFMISTGRVSIFISFSIGLFIFLIVTLEKRIFKDVGVFLAFISFFVLAIFQFAPSLFKNIAFRIASRITHRDENTEIANIFIANIKNTLISFSDNIWFGSGLGGFVNHYSEFEIHGSYLKVLGETGLIGVFGYIIFMGYLLYIVYKNRNTFQTNFFHYFIPFFIASLLSWSYNYHFRKKEFWLLFAVLMILDFNIRRKKIKIEE